MEISVDPFAAFTAVCNAIAAGANLEVARLNAMTPAQREAYLQPGINVIVDGQKALQDIAGKVFDAVKLLKDLKG